MTDPKLEAVFKQNGIPTYTFVEPDQFDRLKVALRSPGRAIIVEGPSGIGKTTAIEYAIKQVSQLSAAQRLSGRIKQDQEIIRELPDIKQPGTVVVDDFHRLTSDDQQRIADFLKVLADEERDDARLVVVGIPDAGQQLIRLADDLMTRVERVRFESNSDEKIQLLIRKGEEALNIKIPFIDEIVLHARGSFYIAQMLCYESCIKAGILDRREAEEVVPVSFEAVKAQVYRKLDDRFRDRTSNFCRGVKFNPSGRAPYLNILRLFSGQNSWSINLRDIIREQTELRGSVGQVVEKGFLEDNISRNSDIQKVLHYNTNSTLMTVEDPQYLFYIREIPWETFAKEVGFTGMKFDRRFDFALSFAGADLDVAERLYNALVARDMQVFYDKAEQHRLLSKELEDYFAPIYQSEARIVICVMGREYPNRIWTQFESRQFKERLEQAEVVVVLVDDNELSQWDEVRRRGHARVRRASMEQDIEGLVDQLVKKFEVSQGEETH